MPGEERRRDRLDPNCEGAARHGVAAPRGQGPPSGPHGGRFTRMFPALRPGNPGVEAIEALVERLAAVPPARGEIWRIPAGYTYLGQFVDHDITFDPTSNLQRDNDPRALVNFRTPRFDLDSLYGSGPADQPFLYDWCCAPHPGVKLLVGGNRSAGDDATVDLPRNDQGRALIGDARNDENLIISQLHLLFIRFHNKVVDHVCQARDGLTGAELFDEAQRIVRWHYQWIVVHDFLPRIAGKDVTQSVLPRLVFEHGVAAPTVERRIYRWRGEPQIPVEFSGAAFRFGHSMVRPEYELRAGAVPVPILPAPGKADCPHLGGFRPLPASLTIDHWTRFFFEPGSNDPGQAAGGHPVRSLRIDHRLAAPLFSLPPDGAVLARLNLLRGRALGLPSGHDVARAMGQPPLTEEALLPEPEKPDERELWPRHMCPQQRAAVLRAPPLWFYLLREADTPPTKGRRLGPVGARIVAEVLVGLLEGDQQSYVSQAPTWRPHELLPDRDDFTMADLVRFTVPGEGGPPADDAGATGG